MYNSKQIKSLVSKSDSLIYYNIQYINKRVIQAPQNCVLPVIFNPSGKIVFVFFSIVLIDLINLKRQWKGS